MNKLIISPKMCLDLFFNLLNNGISYRFVYCFMSEFYHLIYYNDFKTLVINGLGQ